LVATSVAAVSEGATVTGEASLAVFAGLAATPTGGGATAIGLTGWLLTAGTDVTGWVTEVDVFAATATGAGARSGVTSVEPGGCDRVAGAAATTGSLFGVGGDTNGFAGAVKALAAGVEGAAGC
jgi:hypothetical protein